MNKANEEESKTIPLRAEAEFEWGLEGFICSLSPASGPGRSTKQNQRTGPSWAPSTAVMPAASSFSCTGARPIPSPAYPHSSERTVSSSPLFIVRPTCQGWCQLLHPSTTEQCIHAQNKLEKAKKATWRLTNMGSNLGTGETNLQCEKSGWWLF